MHQFKTLKIVSIGLLFFGAVAPAQQQTPPPPAGANNGKASISGVVVDSLHRSYLAGAEVIIEGARKTVTTDSLGRFKADSLTPGDFQVGVFHPVLDTLGITLATRPFHLGPDSSTFIVLSVPSAPSIIRSSCPPRPRARGSSAVIGHVQDPETLQPVSGAEVSLAWTEIEVSKEYGVRQTPRLLYDSTDANGAFVICGLPSPLEATLLAKRAGSLTAEVPIALGADDTELFARTLLLSRADSTTRTGKASVSGKVVLQGNPVGAGSRVEVVGTDVVATTNEKGEFTLNNLPSGTRVLLARHLGFEAETVPVDLTSRESKKVTIRLAKFIPVMDPVVVNARREVALDKVGFSRRSKSANGYFLSPERIQQMRPNQLTDVLRQVPGLRVNYSPTGDVVTSARGVGNGCVQFYVDDMPWQSVEPGDINNFVNGNEIVAMEVYNGPGAPAQYAGSNGCAVVLVWTRMKIRN